MADYLSGEHEALLQFMYVAPVGLIQAAIDGRITMINPTSSRLLMPLQRDGAFSNLFDAIETVAPELRNMTRDFADERGTICQALRFPIRAGKPRKLEPLVLEITLIKTDADHLMAVLSDATHAVERDRQQQQSEAWFHAALAGAAGSAVVPLDAR